MSQATPQIPASSVQFLDARGYVTKEWYRYLQGNPQSGFPEEAPATAPVTYSQSAQQTQNDKLAELTNALREVGVLVD